MCDFPHHDHALRPLRADEHVLDTPPVGRFIADVRAQITRAESPSHACELIRPLFARLLGDRSWLPADYQEPAAESGMGGAGPSGRNLDLVSGPHPPELRTIAERNLTAYLDLARERAGSRSTPTMSAASLFGDGNRLPEGDGTRLDPDRVAAAEPLSRDPPSRPLAFASVPEGSGNENTERSLRTQAELGRLLAAAKGYRVLAGDGTPVGWLDHVRYERHADHPDEIVVRSRSLVRRRRVLPFDMVKEVRPRERTVVLRTTRGATEPSPST